MHGFFKTEKNDLRRFFPYFGSKFKTARNYPRPKHRVVIEPFAGSACYALRYHDREIRLYEAAPIPFGVWDYLIHTPASEIRKLPIPKEHISEVSDRVCQEARWLMGYWMRPGNLTPGITYSGWALGYKELNPKTKSMWCESCRDHLAYQVERIRHWKVFNKSYEQIKFNGEATWFIDPPYQNLNVYNGAKVTDYIDLRNWCLRRMGQIIVCEQVGADWLPFKHFRNPRSAGRSRRNTKDKKDYYTNEVIWLNDEGFHEINKANSIWDSLL